MGGAQSTSRQARDQGNTGGGATGMLPVVVGGGHDAAADPRTPLAGQAGSDGSTYGTTAVVTRSSNHYESLPPYRDQRRFAVLRRCLSAIFLGSRKDARLNEPYAIMSNAIYHQIIIALSTGLYAALSDRSDATANTALSAGITHFNDLPLVTQTVLRFFYESASFVGNNNFQIGMRVLYGSFLALNLASNGANMAHTLTIHPEKPRQAVPGKNMHLIKRILHAGAGIAFTGWGLNAIERLAANVTGFIANMPGYAQHAAQQMIAGSNMTCAEEVINTEFQPGIVVNGTCAARSLASSFEEFGADILSSYTAIAFTFLAILALGTIVLMGRSCTENRTHDAGPDRPSQSH